MARSKYSIALKKTLVAKYLSNPEHRIGKFSRDNGVPESCLREWIRDAEGGILGVVKKKKRPLSWTLAEKFEALQEYDKLDEKEQYMWLRKNGAISEQIDTWRDEI